MAEDSVLEILSLRQHHPKLVLADVYGKKLILRLCYDPTLMPLDCVSRSVTVEFHDEGSSDPVSVEREIGWKGLERFAGDYCQRLGNSEPKDGLTEGAAIALMGLLVHDLVGATIGGVLRKGSGGDYEARYRKPRRREKAIQIEVSGIREDSTPSAALTRTRLREKTAQVLRLQLVGIVSVTAFKAFQRNEVLSLLHFVKRIK